MAPILIRLSILQREIAKAGALLEIKLAGR